MNPPKRNRRKVGARKLEPIDWHEFANDAVLNGNMSTLYHRPPTEDPRSYASAEALLEIEKRVPRPVQSGIVIDVEPGSTGTLSIPTVGTEPTVGANNRGLEVPGDVNAIDVAVGIRPTVGTEPRASSALEDVGVAPTVGSRPTVGFEQSERVADLVGPVSTVGPRPAVGSVPTVGPASRVGVDVSDASALFIPTVGRRPTVVSRETESGPPTVGSGPTVGTRGTIHNSADHLGPEGSFQSSTGGVAAKKPTVGVASVKRVKPIRDVQDSLTLAGQVLYKAMYGVPDGARSKSCTKGYRQLAAETHLDKDTVRDLISEFKDKGIVRETGTYDPDTRSSKTYEILSYKAILQIWRDANLLFVTTGRQRPMFCTAQGDLLTLRPTVGLEPRASRRTDGKLDRPTVGRPTTAPTARSEVAPGARQQVTEVIQALQQITGTPVDQEAADRLILNCRTAAPDCTIEEIIEFAWSKAFLCRSRKIENPIGFLITQVPKHFQGEALQAYRDNRRKELEAAAALATREEQRRQEAEREIAEVEERQRLRRQIAERHRLEQGIDLKGLVQDSEADDVLKQWAKRMLKLGHRYHPRYD
jgi:hypothetical protein